MLSNKLYSSIIEALLVNENLLSTNSHIKKKPTRPEFMTPLAVKMNVK